MRHMADEGFGPAPFGDVVGDLEKATDAAGVVAHRGDRDVDRYARAVAMHVRPFAFVGRRVAAGRDDHLDVDRTSVVSGKSVSVRVDLGGRRIIKKKKNTDVNDRNV